VVHAAPEGHDALALQGRDRHLFHKKKTPQKKKNVQTKTKTPQKREVRK